MWSPPRCSFTVLGGICHVTFPGYPCLSRVTRLSWMCTCREAFRRLERRSAPIPQSPGSPTPFPTRAPQGSGGLGHSHLHEILL